jgi:predicted secreted protein
MGLINGTNLVIKVGTSSLNAVPLLKATSASLELSVDMPDATTKDSAGWSEFFAGVRSWTLSSDGLVDYATSTSVETDELVAMLIARTPMYVEFATGTTGDMKLSGSAYVTSISQTADKESPAGFSVSFQGTGALTQAVV